MPVSGPGLEPELELRHGATLAWVDAWTPLIPFTAARPDADMGVVAVTGPEAAVWLRARPTAGVHKPLLSPLPTLLIEEERLREGSEPGEGACTCCGLIVSAAEIERRWRQRRTAEVEWARWTRELTLAP